MVLPGGNRRFTKEIDAVNENTARDKTFKLLGSHYKLKRSKIKIQSIRPAEGN